MNRGLVLPPGAFRLTLALMVIVSHISRFDVGRLAVLLFFLLSGYWTARIWSEKFGPGATLRFYASRYLRIAPLYFLALAAGAALLGQHLHVENLTLLGVASTLRDPTAVSWSLDVELQYYLLLPAILAVLVSGSVWSVISVLALSLLGWVLKGTLGLATVLMYLPAFAIGATIYAKAWKPTERTATISLAAFLVVTALVLLTPFGSKTAPQPFDHDIFDFVWMLPLVPYVARSLTMRSSKLDRAVGNVSYPLYLFHAMTITMFEQALPGYGWAKLLGAAVAVLLAVGIYRLVDRPVDRWRVRLTEGRGMDSTPLRSAAERAI